MSPTGGKSKALASRLPWASPQQCCKWDSSCSRLLGGLVMMSISTSHAGQTLSCASSYVMLFASKMEGVKAISSGSKPQDEREFSSTTRIPIKSLLDLSIQSLTRIDTFYQNGAKQRLRSPEPWRVQYHGGTPMGETGPREQEREKLCWKALLYPGDCSRFELARYQLWLQHPR